MNELREELRAVAERVPSTRVAEGAWDTARARVRRRRAAAVVAAAAVVVATSVGLQAVTGGPSEVEPAPLPPTRDSLVEVASDPVAGERLDPLLGQVLPERRGDREVVPLAEDPLDGPALYAVGVGKREVQVLGEDGRYRSIPGLETIVNGGQPLRSGSLSPDATQLAIPQPGRVLVVDLSDGTSVAVEAGGISTTDVAWVDDDTIAVYAGRLVRTVDVGPDLDEEEVRASVSDVVGTGLPVTGLPGAEWYPEVPGLVVDGAELRVPAVRRGAALIGPVPVSGDGWVAVAAEPAEESDLPPGVAILDTATGRPRAFLPMDAIGSPERSELGQGISSPYYGAPAVVPLSVEGATEVVVGMQTVYGVLVLRWDWAADTLEGLVAEETGNMRDGTAISWGAGR